MTALRIEPYQGDCQHERSDRHLEGGSPWIRLTECKHCNAVSVDHMAHPLMKDGESFDEDRVFIWKEYGWFVDSRGRITGPDKWDVYVTVGNFAITGASVSSDDQ